MPLTFSPHISCYKNIPNYIRVKRGYMRTLIIAIEYDNIEGRSIAGYSPTHGGMVTTSIVQRYDPEKDQITTYSGSVYQLKRIAWDVFDALRCSK